MDDRALLRHSLAVLAYRCGKLLRNAPESFAAHDTGNGRTPLHILAHISDLMDWALSMARGKETWNNAKPGGWSDEAARFHAAIASLDAYVASDAPLHAETTRLLQGPIADALTHVGQIAILRRMAGSPVIGENYFAADIQTGRVGPEQSPPVRPFKK
ncbi:MAG TPA: hypothetical protein VEY91_06680 [Candidatus Limnocylindria bacterium]|nr:hypothetical protein [Candidatus Limnocylindria bacterium]